LTRLPASPPVRAEWCDEITPHDTSDAKAARARGGRVCGAVVSKLGTAIVSGEYAPGDILPGEIVASEARHVSRSAYREALQVLAAKGLVVSRPHAGTRVLPRDRWYLLDQDVLAWAFTSDPDPALVQSLFELRLVIEPAAAALAAKRCTKADVGQMADALERMRFHSLATEEGRAADCDFHDALLRTTGNQAIMVISASIGAAVTWTTDFKHRLRALPRDPVADHALVLEAVAAKDVERATCAMRSLVELALEETKAAMASLSTP
jgi:DNA-binding FadR family transcriptional regulator